jgi:hypothetical protein
VSEDANDVDDRAHEIIRDLDRDGYPEDIQLMIVTHTLAILEGR